MERKNKNRGYQRLRVWQDAVTLYVDPVGCLSHCLWKTAFCVQ